MKFQVLPVFSDIFPDEPIPKKSDLLAIIPTDAIIRACCHINAQLHNSVSPFEKEKKAFMGLIQRMPLDVQEKIVERLKQFVKESTDYSIGIFPILHTLKLIEDSYLNYKEGTFSNSTPDEELGILKLFLVHNHEANESLKAKLETDFKGEQKMYQLFWTNLLPTSTYLQKKDFIISMYKSVKFLTYLEKFKPDFLKNYLQIYGLDNKMRIVWMLFELQANSYKKEKDQYVSYFTKGQLDHNNVAQSLLLDLVNGSRKEYAKNLKGLRASPLIKYANGDIGISDWNFIIAKYFDGLVFDFFYKSGLNTGQHTDFDNYNNDLGSNFSNPMFMDLMSSMFKKDGIIALREGEKNKDCNYDFYIRIRNHVFLFEFKDIFFPIKGSYEEIKAVLDERLTGEKGVGQIIKQIEKLSKNPASFDDFGEYSIDRLFIHPVIVYTDSSFGMTGINHYLNSNFKDNLSHEVKSKFFYINPLSMVHLDFFLERFELFEKGEIGLVEVFNTFYQRREANIEMCKKFNSHESFIALFEGFDNTMSYSYAYQPKSNVGGALYNDVLDAVKPFLAKS